MPQNKTDGKTDWAQDVVLAIPSKGSLYEGTLAFLKASGTPVIYGNQRQYSGRLGGIEGFSVLFQRAEEIPAKVASGAADIGITGEDLYREQAAHSEKLVPVYKQLGYGHARLVIAVPATWIDVTSVEDLAELSLSFRLRHQRTLRIATKFPNLSREFLAEHGMTDYSLVESMGATESAPASGVADLIIDLTSSGATLAENHLKTLSDGTVISSEACMIGNRAMAAWPARRLERVEALLDMMESHLQGRKTYSIQTAIRRGRLTEMVRLTHTLRIGQVLAVDNLTPGGATDSDASVMIRLTCQRDAVHQVVRRLRESGAEEIIVTQPEYVFRAQSDVFQQLKWLLKKGSSE